MPENRAMNVCPILRCRIESPAFKTSKNPNNAREIELERNMSVTEALPQPIQPGLKVRIVPASRARETLFLIPSALGDSCRTVPNTARTVVLAASAAGSLAAHAVTPKMR